MEKAEKERKKKLSFRFVATRREIENSKKKAKVFKKLKNTITPSSQAKIGWKRLRKGKKKLTFCFVPARREIENSKKIAKNSKTLKIP